MRSTCCGLLVALALPCWSAAAEGKSGGGGAIVIGVSIPIMGYPVYDEFRKGLESEAVALGVKLDISFAQNLAANQVDDIQRFVEDRVGGIVVSPVPKGAHGSGLDLGPTIDAAVSAGVPVAIGCGWAEADRALVRVIGDDVKAGQMAAQLVIEKLGGKGSVVELEGPPGAGFRAPYKAAFEETLRGSSVRLVASEPAGLTESDGERAMSAILARQPAFDAVLAFNDELAIAAVRVLSRAGVNSATKVIVGFDATPDVRQLVEDGKVTATFDADPREQGRQTLRALVEYLREKKAPASRDLHVAPRLIAKEPRN